MALFMIGEVLPNPFAPPVAKFWRFLYSTRLPFCDKDEGKGDNGDVAPSPHCQWPAIMAEHLCNWLHSPPAKIVYADDDQSGGQAAAYAVVGL